MYRAQDSRGGGDDGKARWRCMRTLRAHRGSRARRPFWIVSRVTHTENRLDRASDRSAAAG